MPQLWSAAYRDDAERCLHLFLPMHRLWGHLETQGRRLLRLLLVWVGAVPAYSDRARRRHGSWLLPHMNAQTNDWVRQPQTAFLWWCLPLAIGFSLGLLGVPARLAAAIWAVLFLWMGSGCLLNALRCHRLHCYISGPIFFLGAAASVLFAMGLIHIHLNNMVGAILLLVLASFLPEIIWTRYRQG